MLLTTLASFRLAQTALKCIGAVVKVVHKGDLADLFDLAGGTVELAEDVTEAHHSTIVTLITKIQKRLKRGYEEMVEREGVDFDGRLDVRAAFSSLNDVLNVALPDVHAILEANLDTARITALIADKAAEADGQFAADRIGHRILVELVSAAYDEAKQDKHFAETLSIPISQELLSRTGRLEELLRTVASQTGKRDTLSYDSDNENPPFGSWFTYSENGVSEGSFGVEVNDEGCCFRFSSQGNESVGINKSINSLRGIIKFEYVAYSNINGNVAMYVIPIQNTRFDQFGMIEVGSDRMADRANGVSPYRKRLTVAGGTSSLWQKAQIEFDFSMISGASYTVFGPRINEGCFAQGSAKVLIRKVKIFDFK